MGLSWPGCYAPLLFKPGIVGFSVLEVLCAWMNLVVNCNPTIAFFQWLWFFIILPGSLMTFEYVWTKLYTFFGRADAITPPSMRALWRHSTRYKRRKRRGRKRNWILKKHVFPAYVVAAWVWQRGGR